MKKLTLNREYATRHLFVAILMAGLSCWFGYDGLVRYPATPAAELYRSVEGCDAPEGCDLEAFKDQKTKTQYGFAALSLLASLVVGFRLCRASALDVAFDEEGLVVRGRRRAFADVKKVDWSRWEKKGIVVVDGLVLDAWHHQGVKELAEGLKR